MRWALAIAAALTGCGPLYTYVPTKEAAVRDAPTVVDGHQAAAYEVPDGDHRGQVQVALVGVGRLRPSSGSWTARTLHVRLVVHNAGGEVWMVQPYDQVAKLDADHHAAPLLASADGAEGITSVVVEPGDTRTVELYYELPESLTAEQIRGVRVDWRIAAPGRTIAREDTPFERKTLPRPAVFKGPTVDGLRAAAEPDHTGGADDQLPRADQLDGRPSWRD